MIMAATLNDPVNARIIVSASIVAGKRRRYSVRFAPGAASGRISDHDYLRFTVHYYAYVLYELASARAVGRLPSIVDALTSATHGWDGDVFAFAGIRGVMAVDVGEPIGSVNVVLRNAGRDFYIDGDLHLTGQPLAFSVLAVFQTIFCRVSPDMLVTILTALANMNASYSVTHRYNDPRGKSEVPSIACMAAAFV